MSRLDLEHFWMSDSSGSLDSSMTFYPFGGTRSGSVNTDQKFTGQRLDTGTGLYYYGARYYDPLIGRFISADKRFPTLIEPQELNRYSYVTNNPLKYNDPTGATKTVPTNVYRPIIDPPPPPILPIQVQFSVTITQRRHNAISPWTVSCAPSTGVALVHYDISGTIEISATGEGTRASIDFEIEQRNALANSEMPAADYRLQKPKVFFDRDIGPLEIPGGREEGPFIGEPNVEYYHYEEVSWSIPYPYPRDVFYVQLTMGQVLGSYPVDELPGYLDPGGFEIDLWTGDVHNLGYY